MEVKELEERIKRLKAKLAEKRDQKTGPEKDRSSGLRKIRKQLKRAQRRRRGFLTQVAFIEAKSQKKARKGAEAGKGAS